MPRLFRRRTETYSYTCWIYRLSTSGIFRKVYVIQKRLCPPVFCLSRFYRQALPLRMPHVPLLQAALPRSGTICPSRLCGYPYRTKPLCLLLPEPHHLSAREWGDRHARPEHTFPSVLFSDRTSYQT